ncbi:hypothetical protein B0H13DRAFT_2327400 [Mycena leptocephala]|nr:hypothetical protein B0H13DRAFT_2327400 [Mycena leptocephala]
MHFFNSFLSSLAAFAVAFAAPTDLSTNTSPALASSNMVIGQTWRLWAEVSKSFVRSGLTTMQPDSGPYFLVGIRPLCLALFSRSPDTCYDVIYFTVSLTTLGYTLADCNSITVSKGFKIQGYYKSCTKNDKAPTTDFVHWEACKVEHDW